MPKALFRVFFCIPGKLRSIPGMLPRPSEASNPVARDTIRQVLQETPVGVRSQPDMGGLDEARA